ncbi:MAG: hypothetical protein ACTHW1_04900 [Ancrocorticia sp.]|uniref:hypothetical protein n=1 Tax=Ancrocorticia sp. TaxID=2593684 RepID=UPI003F929C0A
MLDYELRDPDAYVAGTEPTLVDIQLFSVLALFDQGIRREFGWGAASVRDYPYVWRYARKLAQRHGLLTQSEKQWIGLDGAGADGTNAAWDIPYRILEPLDREP